MLSELIVALLVIVTLVWSVVAMLDGPQRAMMVQTHTAELHQRSRSILARLHRDVGNAGVALHAGPYPRAAVVPTRSGVQSPRGSEPSDLYDASALTLVQTDGERRATLLSPLASSLEVVVRSDVGCPTREETTCGFRAGSAALVVDSTGRSDLLRVATVRHDRLGLAAPYGHLPRYAPGSVIVPASVRTYAFDPSRFQLRYRRDWGTDMPVLNDVVGVTFRYVGIDAWPSITEPPPRSVDRCLSDLPSVSSAAIPHEVELSSQALSDGPWCGNETQFDVDLLRVRRVRVEVRLDASTPELRGRPSDLFARPGFAVGPARWIPDFTVRFDVSLRVTWAP